MKTKMCTRIEEDNVVINMIIEIVITFSRGILKIKIVITFSRGILKRERIITIIIIITK